MSDETEDEAKAKAKKKKEKEKPPEDHSTPDPLDEDFAKWLVRLHRNNEKAQFLIVTQLVGRSGNTRGEVVRRLPLPAAEEARRPEDMVAMSNELIEDMREEANVYRTPRRFIVEATSSLKGGVFASRPVEVTPNRMYARDSMSDDDDDGVDPMGGDILRKRTETVLQDGRFYSEQMSLVSGGMMQLLIDQNKELHAQVKEMINSWLGAMREKNLAENNALEREIIREKERFKLEMQRSGFNLAAKLLPGVIDTVKNHGKDGAPSEGNGRVSDNGTHTSEEARKAVRADGRTVESLAIESAMRSLDVAEKTRIFGVWTDSGLRTQAGYLTEAQVRIIVGVLNQEVDVAAIDRLLEGPDKISDEQLMQVLGAAAIEKLEPLLKIVNEHKETLAKRARLASTN